MTTSNSNESQGLSTAGAMSPETAHQLAIHGFPQKGCSRYWVDTCGGHWLKWRAELEHLPVSGNPPRYAAPNSDELAAWAMQRFPDYYLQVDSIPWGGFGHMACLRESLESRVEHFAQEHKVRCEAVALCLLEAMKAETLRREIKPPATCTESPYPGSLPRDWNVTDARS